MVSKNKNTYCPDYAIPPGVTLLETIRDMGITQSELAQRMGRPKKTINEIIKGKAEITPETAIQLEHVINVPANFWLSLEKNYRLDLARIAEAEELAKQKEWLKSFPLNAMRKYKWIENVKDDIYNIAQMLAFFGVATIDAWRQKWGIEIPSVMFRKSKTYEVSPPALAAWLRKGEIEASSMTVDKFNKKLFKEKLKEIRELTTLEPDEFIGKMTDICASCGVLLVFVPELPKVPVHGVTRWVSADKVIIQLSLYKKKDDHFWFSFFHEAGHVILHGKRDFVYDETNLSWDEEADKFARDTLISESAYEYFVKHNTRRFTPSLVQEFAASQNIAPGIVVGRLQHDNYINFTRLNNLKRTFVWNE